MGGQGHGKLETVNGGRSRLLSWSCVFMLESGSAECLRHCSPRSQSRGYPRNAAMQVTNKVKTHSTARSKMLVQE